MCTTGNYTKMFFLNVSVLQQLIFYLNFSSTVFCKSLDTFVHLYPRRSESFVKEVSFTIALRSTLILNEDLMNKSG